MRRSRQRLEKLRTYAGQKANHEAGTVAKAQRELRTGQEAVRRAETEVNRQPRAVPNAGAAASAATLGQAQLHLHKLGADLRRARAEVHRQQTVLEAQQRRYVEARQQEEKFELLRQRRFAQWRVETNRDEQRASDESAARAWCGRVTDSVEIAASHGNGGRSDEDGSELLPT